MSEFFFGPKCRSFIKFWTPPLIQGIYKGQNFENQILAITFEWSVLWKLWDMDEFLQQQSLQNQFRFSPRMAPLNIVPCPGPRLKFSRYQHRCSIAIVTPPVVITPANCAIAGLLCRRKWKNPDLSRRFQHFPSVAFLFLGRSAFQLVFGKPWA